jgi:hypothetical protein
MAVTSLRKTCARPPEVAIGGAWHTAHLEAKAKAKAKAKQAVLAAQGVQVTIGPRHAMRHNSDHLRSTP